jgi:predicted SprT family Zn-dependent metalloprotease
MLIDRSTMFSLSTSHKISFHSRKNTIGVRFFDENEATSFTFPLQMTYNPQKKLIKSFEVQRKNELVKSYFFSGELRRVSRKKYTHEDDQKILAIISRELSMVISQKLHRNIEEVKNLLLNIDINQSQYSFTIQEIKTILKLCSTQDLLKILAEYFRVTYKDLRKHLKELLTHWNKAPFTPEEDQRLIDLVCKYGKKWAMIQKLGFSDRSDCFLRNQFNSFLKFQRSL